MEDRQEECSENFSETVMHKTYSLLERFGKFQKFIFRVLTMYVKKILDMTNADSAVARPLVILSVCVYVRLMNEWR